MLNHFKNFMISSQEYFINKMISIMINNNYWILITKKIFIK